MRPRSSHPDGRALSRLLALDETLPVSRFLTSAARNLGEIDDCFIAVFSRVESLSTRVVFSSALADRPESMRRRLRNHIVEEADNLQAGSGSGLPDLSDLPDLAGEPPLTALLCADQTVQRALAPSRSTALPFLLGGLVFRRNAGGPSQEARGVRHLLGLYLSRHAAILDLCCHQRSLELINTLQVNLLEGPLTPLGLDRILSTIEGIFPLDAMVLGLPSDEGPRLIYRLPQGTPSGLLKAIKDQVDFVMGDDAAKDRPVQSEHVIRPARRGKRRPRATVESSIILPLGDRPDSGFLGLFSATPGGLSPQDVRLLGLLVPSLTTAFASGHSIYTLQEGQRRFDQDIEMARVVQHHLRPRLPLFQRGIRISQVSQSARGIGGDLFDAVTFPDGRAGFLVADVSGKGIAAALVGSFLKGLLRSTWEEGKTPAAVLAALEKGVSGYLEEGRFVTAAVAIVDPETGRVDYAVAGHEPILLVEKAGERVTELTTEATPIGIGLGPRAIDATAHLGPDGLLVLYTDGVTETRRSGGERFGNERLHRELLLRAGRDPRVVVAKLLESLEAFRGEESLADDLTIVVLQLGRSDPKRGPGSVSG